MKKYYEKYLDYSRKQWFKECKPHGFDVIELRLGGMIQRTTDAAQRLTEWISGKINRIPELEEKVLSYINENYDFKPIDQAQFEEIYSQYRL